MNAAAGVDCGNWQRAPSGERGYQSPPAVDRRARVATESFKFATFGGGAGWHDHECRSSGRLAPRSDRSAPPHLFKSWLGVTALSMGQTAYFVARLIPRRGPSTAAPVCV